MTFSYVMKIIEFGRDLLLKHVLSKLLATTFNEDHSVIFSDICVLVTTLIFSFVYVLQLGDDLWPHSQEGSEKIQLRNP